MKRLRCLWLCAALVIGVLGTDGPAQIRANDSTPVDLASSSPMAHIYGPYLTEKRANHEADHLDRQGYETEVVEEEGLWYVIAVMP